MPMISVVFLLLTAITGFIIMLINRLCTAEAQKVLGGKIVLLAASFLFACYSDWRFALILAAVSLITWLSAGSQRGYRWGILCCLLALGIFKYMNFFLNTISHLFRGESMFLKLLLPLGISFYVFSAISYLVDVHRGKLVKHSFWDTALYLSFFPKLTSGPIQRSADFFDQISRPRNIGWQSVTAGAQIFCFGLFKKIVLADRLSVFVNQVFDTPMAFSGGTVLLAVISYSFQIYFDFSGYSDIAIGTARMLDIELPQNFNLPYLSHNVTEFWKRWHITLSSWLQDYLYIPLGGSRRGRLRAYLNLVITMVIGGLWHGPSWNFVFWGLLHGLALMLHKIWMARPGKRKKTLPGDILSVLFTFLFVSFTWIFFRTDTIAEAMTLIRAIFTWQQGIFHPYIWLFIVLFLYLSAVLPAVYRSAQEKKPLAKGNTSWVNSFYPMVNMDSFWGMTLFFVFCGLILGLAYTGGSPFIYGGF